MRSNINSTIGLNSILAVAGIFIIGFPYLGPSFLGLGVKPLWILVMCVPILFSSKTSRSFIVVVVCVLLLDTVRWLAVQAFDVYAIGLWLLMITFVFSPRYFSTLASDSSLMLRVIKLFYGLFFLLYLVNYLDPSIYNEFLRAFIGQARTLGRDDFAFASPEAGLGAFSIVTIAYLAFHLSDAKSTMLIVMPVVCLLMIGAATSFLLALIWSLYCIGRTRLSFKQTVLIFTLAFGFCVYYLYLSSDLMIARIFSLISFNLQGDSSVSIRARNLLSIVDYQAYLGMESFGPVGIVKAAVVAPGFTLLLVCIIAYYCKFADIILILPALILLPVTHPFIWVVIGLSRLKYMVNRSKRTKFY